MDGDSDAEKLSPLLVTKKCDPAAGEQNQVEKEQNTHNQDLEKKSPQGNPDRGEDSDYYTPEDSAPTIPLYESNVRFIFLGYIIFPVQFFSTFICSVSEPADSLIGRKHPRSMGSQRRCNGSFPPRHSSQHFKPFKRSLQRRLI